MDSDGCATGIFVVAVLVGGLIGGWTLGRKSACQEAVQHGAAHWEVAADGSTAFVWNEKEKVPDAR